MSEENAERLAEALCRMRGAALKLGKERKILNITTNPNTTFWSLSTQPASVPRVQSNGAHHFS